MTTPVPALERGVAILSLMAEQPASRFRPSEVARSLRLSRATCFSIMACLHDAGLLDRYEDKTYGLGPRLAALGSAAQKRHPGFVPASSEIHVLSRQFEVQCLVAAVIVDEIVVVERSAPSGYLFTQTAFPGSRIKFAPPAGLVYMSWATQDEFDGWLERNGVTVAAEQQRYRDAARIVRERGYAGGLENHQAQLLTLLSRVPELADSSSRDQLATEISAVLRHGVNFVSAPVFSPDGSSALALTVMDPPEAIAGARFDALTRELTAAASRVTAAIGGRHPTH